MLWKVAPSKGALTQVMRHPSLSTKGSAECNSPCGDTPLLAHMDPLNVRLSATPPVEVLHSWHTWTLERAPECNSPCRGTPLLAHMDP